MQVPEEVRLSLNLLSPFQGLAELLCCSSAWSSPSDISSCQSFSFISLPFCGTCVSRPLLCHHAFLTSVNYLSCLQVSLQQQQSLLFYTCNSPATLASAWEWEIEGCWWAVSHTNQLWDLPSPAEPLLFPKCQWEHASRLLQDEGWTVSNAQGSKRFDFQDPKCSSEAQGTLVDNFLLWDVDSVQ